MQINFALKNGERVSAIPVKNEADGTLYCFVNCLDKKYPFHASGKCGYDYLASDLRQTLNIEIIELFPDWMRKVMIPLYHGYDDLLRIPTEKEISGNNFVGLQEYAGITQWEPMAADLKNRISKVKGAVELYWLQNMSMYKQSKREEPYPEAFTAYANGAVAFAGANQALGVRPVFKLKRDADLKALIDRAIADDPSLAETCSLSAPDVPGRLSIPIRPEWKKTCLCLPYEEFEKLCKEVTGLDNLLFHYDLDGMWIDVDDDGEDPNAPEYNLDMLGDDLAAALNIDIESIHIDDETSNVGVWIVYK